MAVIGEFTCDVEVDYGQFRVKRDGVEWWSLDVPDDGYRNGLWSEAGFVYVGTVRKFGITPLVVELHDEEPAEPDDAWQHVVEVSLDAGPTRLLSDQRSVEALGPVTTTG